MFDLMNYNLDGNTLSGIELHSYISDNADYSHVQVIRLH
jgi:hypothetical protein